MPRDSNWKMPLVRPSQNSRKTSGSSSGTSSRSRSMPWWRRILTASSMTVSVRSPRKSILSRPRLLDDRHVPLRHDLLFVALGDLVERHQLVERLRRDDDAGGVHRGVAGEPLQAARRPRRSARTSGSLSTSAASGVDLARRLGERLGHVGDQLGDAVDLGVGDPHHAADVADHRLGRQGPEGDDLRHPVAAVLLAHVVDDLAPPAHAEVDVDVGHADAVGVQEALEQQVVLQRVDVGDAQRVGDHRARRRAAPRPHRDVLFSRA